MFTSEERADEVGKLPPQAQILCDYDNGVKFAYDGKTRGPAWVLEYINLNSEEGAWEKSHPIPDQKLPSILQTKTADYIDSGFVSAPLATALADGKYPLSIASPQLPAFNKGYWRKLRDYVQKLPKKLGAFYVIVITGPLYLPHKEAGEKYVTHRVIGEDNIAVPTHFFQSVFYPVQIVDEDNEESWRVASETYVVPNQEISHDVSLESFKISLTDLEKISGIIFPKDMKPYFIMRGPFPFP